MEVHPPWLGTVLDNRVERRSVSSSLQVTKRRRTRRANLKVAATKWTYVSSPFNSFIRSRHPLKSIPCRDAALVFLSCNSLLPPPFFVALLKLFRFHSKTSNLKSAARSRGNQQTISVLLISLRKRRRRSFPSRSGIRNRPFCTSGGRFGKDFATGYYVVGRGAVLHWLLSRVFGVIIIIILLGIIPLLGVRLSLKAQLTIFEMDNQELKPAPIFVGVPAQQSGDTDMASADEGATQTAAVRPVNKDSRDSVSSDHGSRMSDRDTPAVAAVQSSTPDLVPGSTGAAAVPIATANNLGDGRSTKEAPLLAKVTAFSGANAHRAPKRKKDVMMGSSQLTHSRLSLNKNPSTPASTQCVSQVPFSRISSENDSQSGDLIDSPQNVQSADPAARRAQVRAWGNQPLAVVDSTLWEIMEREKLRQWRGIELIASENFASQAVIEALGSHLTNKYSEGLPGSRYYGGNEYIDMIESLCISRALAAFHLDPNDWGVNVQPYSCTSANFAVYTALLQPKGRIMGLDVPSGGHVSHGYYTASGKKVSGASIFFESLPFKVNPQTGLIDFESLEKFALNYRPKLLICGGSAYPREWDYARFREIANKIGAILLCDMAHISGLIAAQEVANPFDYCDIVTSTTHKSLRGPRGGMIFYRKGLRMRRSNGPDCMYDFEDRINFAVHPSLQGGPHNNHIAALAVALKQVATPEYKQYIQQVKRNAQSLAKALAKRGCVLVTGGTDNHLLLWDLRNRGLTGNRLEKVCEMCHMTLNKNAVFGDSSALGVGGVRIGTPAMTSRGCIEEDFEVIAGFLMKAVQITESIQSEHGKLQKDFVKGLQSNKEIIELRNNVEKFALKFEMPGFEISSTNFIQ